MAKTINLGKVGLTFEGDYDSSKNYASRTCVFYNHVSWVSKKDVPAGIAPDSNDEYWQKVSERGAQGIQGERGPQGNSAFDGTGIELVNNLTQGGEASALSAEQGKILKEELTELGSKVDFSEFVPELYLEGLDENNQYYLLIRHYVAGDYVADQIYIYKNSVTSSNIVSVIEDTELTSGILRFSTNNNSGVSGYCLKNTIAESVNIVKLLNFNKVSNIDNSPAIKAYLNEPKLVNYIDNSSVYFEKNDNRSSVEAVKELFIENLDADKNYYLYMVKHTTGSYSADIIRLYEYEDDKSDYNYIAYVEDTNFVSGLFKFVSKEGFNVNGYIIKDSSLINTTSPSSADLKKDIVSNIDNSPSIKSYLKEPELLSKITKEGLDTLYKINGYKESSSCINVNGEWDNSDSRNSHYVIDVNVGDNIYIKTSDNFDAKFAFLKSYDGNNSKPDFSDEVKGINVIAAVGAKTIVAPSDAKFLYLTKDEKNAQRTPSVLTINGYWSFKGVKGNIENIIEKIESVGAVYPKPYYIENNGYELDTSTPRVFIPSTPKIEHKYNGQVTPDKRYMCIGFDDFRESDFTTYMPLFEKYGFKATFNRIAKNIAVTDVEKQWVNNLVMGGHEIGDHTWKHYQFPFTEPLFNGQDPNNIDGSQVPFPSNSQLRDNRGDGKNVFGRRLTEKMSEVWGSASRPPISEESTWATLSDSECQAIRNFFSVMKDPQSNLIAMLDELSNKYLGTSGSSVGSWSDVDGCYTGGIYSGCKTSANHEIWERVLSLTNIYYKEVFGLNFNFKTWSLPGSKVSQCFFENPISGYRFYDAEYKQLANYLAKFESSLYFDKDGNPKSRSWADVLREYGYVVTHDTLFPNKLDWTPKVVMRRQFILNSNGRRKDAIPYSSNASKNFDFDVVNSSYNTSYKDAEDMYDSDEYDVFRNFLEAARMNMSNGIIDLETTDSYNTYNMRLFYEGLLKYCKETGVELLTKSEAYDVCFNHKVKEGNLIYNPKLRNTVKEFLPNAKLVPNNPDGYTKGCSVSYDDTNTPILTTSQNVYYRHYGVPYGKLRYSAMVKGDGVIRIYAIKNNSPYNLTSLDSITACEFNNTSFEGISIDFNINDAPMTEYEQVCEGYGDKIVGIEIEYPSNIEVKDITLKLL